MNREKVVLFSKLGTVLFLILSVFDYAYVLRPFILTGFLWFSFDSLWKKKISWTAFYSLTSLLYLSTLIFDIKNDFLMPVNYFVSFGIIINILSMYFLSFWFNFLHENGEYSKAESISNIVLNSAADTFGINHPVYATSLSDIGELYFSEGKIGLAEKYFEDSLQIRKQSFSENHPELISLYDKFGTLYYKQHKYTSAEKYYGKSLAIREQVFGHSDLSVAESLNNLALSLSCQHRYIEAESLFIRAIGIWESKKEMKSLELASCLTNLSVIYKSQGNSGEAEKLVSRALEIRENKLDSSHTDVVQSLKNLALLYYSRNKNDEADLLVNRALSVTEDKEMPMSHEELLPSLPEVGNETEMNENVAGVCVNSVIREAFPDLNYSGKEFGNSGIPGPPSCHEDKNINENISNVNYESPEIKSELDYLFSDSNDFSESVSENNLVQHIVCYSDSYEGDVKNDSDINLNTSYVNNEKDIESINTSPDFIWPKKKENIVKKSTQSEPVDVSSDFVWPPQKKADKKSS